MAFVPVIDGDVLPVHPQTALEAGHAADVPLLIGTNTDEFRLFLVPSGVAAAVTSQTLPVFLGAFGIGATTAELYQASRPGASPGDVLCALATDKFFRVPAFAAAAARLAAGGRAATYLYEFGWRSPVRNLGAAHGLDVPFIFDAVAVPEWHALIGPDAPRDLAAEMHAAWIGFASTGDPGWPACDARYPVMTFGAGPGQGTVVLDPRGDERRSWPTD